MTIADNSNVLDNDCRWAKILKNNPHQKKKKEKVNRKTVYSFLIK